ncbi:polyprenyl synthetase family protein [Lactococcus nasutitermitis]|uniref:Polyprenyl synthetase family protein n=1 Tax=Lactococcus nasutitermitis TaxID=1652957 RepID=A0ABV9JEN8_9LACT|nr:farnesyl diphosphate synthase [Lactococcus nasutitermitis]
MTIDKNQLENELVKFYKQSDVPAHLQESVLYSLTAGGKRVRPVLFLELLEAFGVQLEKAHFQVAAALEMIHTGSLIHDDLPAMDDDNYRRGKLTNHVKFDEATAILAGDALFLDPYYVLASCDLPAEIVVALVRELSFASGSLGMVAGQVLDMEAEGKKLNLAEMERLHQLKTGRLLTFPFVAAGIVTEKSEKSIRQLRAIGELLGLAFQIRDDILDVTADFDDIGKTPGKDVLEEKSTYVSLLGLEGAKNELSKDLTEVKKLLTELSNFSGEEIFKLIDSLELK